MAAYTTPRNVLNKDTLLTKIFVGGLPYQTTDESLRNFFEQFGGIDEAVVIMDRITGKSKGYGFVTMTDKESAERACMDPNPIIDGRKANVNLAYLGAKPHTFPFLNTGAAVVPTANTVVPHTAATYAYSMPQMQYVLTPNGYMAMVPGSMTTPPPTTLPQTGYPTLGMNSALTQQLSTGSTESTSLDEDSLASSTDTTVIQQQQIQQQQQQAALIQAQLNKYAALGINSTTAGASVNQIPGLSGLNPQQSAAVLQASHLQGLANVGAGSTVAGAAAANSPVLNQQALLAAKYMSPTAAAYYTYAVPQMMGRGVTQYQPQQLQDRTQ